MMSTKWILTQVKKDLQEQIYSILFLPCLVLPSRMNQIPMCGMTHIVIHVNHQCMYVLRREGSRRGFDQHVRVLLMVWCEVTRLGVVISD